MIVPAPYDYEQSGRPTIHVLGVFKIDTQTGQTWEWEARPDDKGAPTRYWYPQVDALPVPTQPRN